MIMEIIKLVLGLYQTNCYILKKDDELLVIDPGYSPRRIIEKIEALEGCSLKAILLTHGHFDHIGAVDALVNSYHCPVYACKDDEDILVEGKIALHENNGLFVRNKINWLTSENLKIGKFDIRVIFTPGHTSGSVMFVIDGVLFSGDTLFLESVGRTDLYSGSYSQLKQSLKVLNDLPLDMVVYPGHDGKTTVGHELQFNPFL